MKLMEKTVGHISIIGLSGSLDGQTGQQTQDYLLQLLQQGRKFLVLEFSNLSFLASAGLRVLMNINKRSKALEGRIILAGLSDTISGVLEVTGFTPYLEICVTSDEAVKRLQG
jgi:anti-anti-sigma factor